MKQIQKIGVATDLGCSPEAALSQVASRVNAE